MATFAFIFDNPNKFYFEGEMLCAKLEVCVSNPVNISSISVNFIGVSNIRDCSNKTDSNLKFMSNSKNDVMQEVYFDEVLPLYVAEKDKSSEFAKGIHTFQLTYALPSSLPTSLESLEGFVRYSINVIAVVQDNIHKSTCHFTVVSKVDLNSCPSADIPIFIWNHENDCIFNFCCFQTGPVRAFFHLAKRGFIPGELLTINAEVRNLNRLAIIWVKVLLVQVLKFNGTKPSRKKRTVEEITRGCIMPNDRQLWQSESIRIPAIPPSSGLPKRLINVKYKIYFLIKPSWKEKMISFKHNLVIGSVKLMECKPSEERDKGEGESMVKAGTFQYSNLEPCIFGPHTIGDENSATTFSPLYPMYTDP